MRRAALFLACLGWACAVRAAPPALPGSLGAQGRLDASLGQETRAALDRGLSWLTAQQRPDGGWGEGIQTPLALLAFASSRDPAHLPVRDRGITWLLSRGSGAPAASPSRDEGVTSATERATIALALAREAAERPTFRERLPALREQLLALPLPDDPRALAWRMAALAALPDPPAQADATQRMARVAVDSDSAAGAVLLGLQSAGAPRHDAALWKAFDWIRRHPAALAPAEWSMNAYDDLLILAQALAQAGESRLPMADGSLLAWRPLLARGLINRQRVDPATGGLYWQPSGSGTASAADTVAATARALLILQLVLAE